MSKFSKKTLLLRTIKFLKWWTSIGSPSFQWTCVTGIGLVGKVLDVHSCPMDMVDCPVKTWWTVLWRHVESMGQVERYWMSIVILWTRWTVLCGHSILMANLDLCDIKLYLYFVASVDHLALTDVGRKVASCSQSSSWSQKNGGVHFITGMIDVYSGPQQRKWILCTLA